MQIRPNPAWPSFPSRRTFETICNVDLAYLSVGDVSDRSLQVRYGLPDGIDIAELIAHGAVGDLAGHFLNARGVPLFGTAMESVCNAPHFRRSSTFSDLLKADTTTAKLSSSSCGIAASTMGWPCCNAVNCLDNCRPHFGHEAAFADIPKADIGPRPHL